MRDPRIRQNGIRLFQILREQENIPIPEATSLVIKEYGFKSSSRKLEEFAKLKETMLIDTERINFLFIKFLIFMAYMVIMFFIHHG